MKKLSDYKASDFYLVDTEDKYILCSGCWFLENEDIADCLIDGSELSDEVMGMQCGTKIAKLK